MKNLISFAVLAMFSLSVMAVPDPADAPAPSPALAAAADPAPAPAAAPQCSEQLMARIGEILRSDEFGIVGLQFRVTTLKLAKRLNAANKSTLETAVKAESARLNQLNVRDPEVLRQLQALYRAEASNTRLATVERRLADIKAKAPNLNYFRRNTRLSNQDVSNFLLAEQLSNPSGDISEMDVAVTWFMQQASDVAAQESGAGSARHNLTQISTKLAHMLGGVGGARRSLASINTQLESSQAELDQALGRLATSLTERMPACFANGQWRGVDVNSAFVKKIISDMIQFNGIIAPVTACPGPVAVEDPAAATDPAPVADPTLTATDTPAPAPAPAADPAPAPAADPAPVAPVAAADPAPAPADATPAPRLVLTSSQDGRLPGLVARPAIEIGDAVAPVAVDPLADERPAPDRRVAAAAPAAGGAGFGIDAAIAGIRNGTLRYIGREDGDGIMDGGNWSCFYGNDEVYVVVEGCRPSRAQVPEAFRMQVINRNGSMIDLYADNENDPYNVDTPSSNRTWNISAKTGLQVRDNMTAVELRDFMNAAARNYSIPWCGFSANRAPSCHNGTVAGADTIQADVDAPGNRLRQIHDMVNRISR